MVVRIYHRHLVPGSAFEVPGRLRQQKAVRMPAKKGQFPIEDHCIRGGQRLRQVRPPLRPAAAAARARDGEKGEQYEGQALHAYKDSELFVVADQALGGHIPHSGPAVPKIGRPEAKGLSRSANHSPDSDISVVSATGGFIDV